MKARPLYDSQGRPYLDYALDEIETKWGTVEIYLDKVLGVDKAEITRLRALYLE
jgi:protein-tyrosine phosphatase